jgi:hypothetical protein
VPVRQPDVLVLLHEALRCIAWLGCGTDVALGEP